jgi:hypothetical protein
MALLRDNEPDDLWFMTKSSIFEYLPIPFRWAKQKTIARRAMVFLGSGGQIRTDDLRVMNVNLLSQTFALRVPVLVLPVSFRLSQAWRDRVNVDRWSIAIQGEDERF